ncbi:MAG: ubiquinone biosynthesis regulatory protein kinase UbiB, partial [Candidatus Sedimenticola sp. 6PFRAG5]
ADMPLLAHKVLKDASEGRLELKWKSRELEQMHQTLKENHRNTIASISGAAMLVSGAMLLTLGPSIMLPATVVITTGIGLSVAGGFILLSAWIRSL